MRRVYNIPIYNVRLVCVVPDQVDEELRDYAMAVEQVSIAKIKVIFNKDHRDTWTVGYLAHEALHVTHNILKDRDIFFSDETEEVYAYLLAFVTDKLYKFTNEEKENK